MGRFDDRDILDVDIVLGCQDDGFLGGVVQIFQNLEGFALAEQGNGDPVAERGYLGGGEVDAAGAVEIQVSQ